MKVITHTFPVYSFDELDDAAKENAKKWYLDDDLRGEFLHDDILENLNRLFPNSDLKVCFSLGYCQGDGLNVYGTIKFTGFLKVDERARSNVFKNYTKKELKRLEFYFKYFNEYTFNNDGRYCYSHKFIDKKYEDQTIAKYTDELEYNGIRDIDYYLIDRFFCDLLEWFTEYDSDMETSGYKYLYEIEDEEMQEICDANDWTFLEDGTFYDGGF